MFFDFTEIYKFSFVKSYVENKESGTVEKGKKIKLSVFVSRRIPIDTIISYIYSDHNNYKYELNFHYVGSICGYDRFESEFTPNCESLYFYKIKLISNFREVFLVNKLSGDDVFQFTCFIKNKNPPDWFAGSVMYQIFTDRFKKSNTPKSISDRRSYKLNENWYNSIPEYPETRGGKIENNEFFGGDLYGVAEKLSYLKSLGVGCIYLNPIFEAYSNHKYDTGNYLKVDSMFGGEEALKHLISEGNKLGIKIILDGVFNHTGDDSLYFNKYGTYKSVGAYESKESEYSSWYNFFNYPDGYESWWGISILPKVREEGNNFIDFICEDGGVIKHYMNMGVSGFRLDVVDELSDSFVKRINYSLKNSLKDGLLIGEVWEFAQEKISSGGRRKYFLGNELDSVMNYPLKDAILGYLLTGNSDEIKNVQDKISTYYPKQNVDLLMNIIGTHDTPRVISVLSGVDYTKMSMKELAEFKLSESQYAKAKKLTKIASFLQFTLPGVPCIYYGDEAGMEGFSDPFNRNCFPWGKADEELTEWYKNLSKIRGDDIFKYGDYRCLVSESGVFAFTRYSEHSCLLLFTNVSESTAKFRISGVYKDVLSGEIYENTVSIKPLGCKALKNIKK